ncbi:FCD domain-containing protein [Actinoplanes sp. NPDC051633]|uniref:FCD domain-containing protein n=1 Tax=Actinoplanes sp. NPDC051633 TaxID=3155670 RepID=UPI003419B4D4
MLKHRRRLGLTQEELADQSGLSVRTVRRLEAGRSQTPRAASVRRLAAALRLERAEYESFLRSASGTTEDSAPMPTGHHGEMFGGSTVVPSASGGWLVLRLPRLATHFIGRDAEVARLLAAIHRYRRARPMAVNVESPTGRGKTAPALDMVDPPADDCPLDPPGHAGRSPLLSGLVQGTNALSELLELRKVLETALIEDAMRALTPQSRSALHSVLAQAKAHAERGEAVPDQDRDFHRLLFADLGNEMLLQVFDLFWVAFDRASPPSCGRTPMDSYQWHADILDAVDAGDAERARTAVREHYLGIEQRIEDTGGDRT